VRDVPAASIPVEWVGLHARIYAGSAGAFPVPELGVKLAEGARDLAQRTTDPGQVLIWTTEALHESLATQTGPDDSLRQQARHMLDLALAEGHRMDRSHASSGKVAPEALRAFYDKLVAQATQPA
jgi:hypothetical protein